jgi:murein DD-endopeptidase MepM/ murein hydrolase activator NlpD
MGFLILAQAGCGWMEVSSSRAPGKTVQLENRGASALAAVARNSGSLTARQDGLSVVQPIPPGGTVIARPGESVYGLSRRYGIPMRAIIEASQLSAPFHLRIGQRVVLPIGRAHVVSSGENLHTISLKYGADVYSLARVNRIVDGNMLYIGQRLHIPEKRRDVVGLPSAGQTAPTVRVSELRPLLPTPSVPSPPSTSLDLPGPVPQSKVASPVVASTQVVSRPARAPVAMPTSLPMVGGGFMWPIRGKVIAKFGPQARGLHNDGLNISAPRGAKVMAAESGVVAYAGNELRGFGNLLLIKHDDGWVTAYAHNGTLLVRRGDKVARGQTIARVGSSGGVTDPQLHFELRRGPHAVDPLDHLRSPVG